jgi:hypothetical protein
VDTALAIVTMMEMVMMVAAHPLLPQTVVFKFMPNAKFYPCTIYLLCQNAWLSGICIQHTSQKPCAKKGIFQSFNPPQGAVICKWQ